MIACTQTSMFDIRSDQPRNWFGQSVKQLTCTQCGGRGVRDTGRRVVRCGFCRDES